MLNIRMEDCQFTVYPNSKTVVCVIPDTKYLFLNSIPNTSHLEGYDLRRCAHPRLYMPPQFVGVAQCSPEDEFDVEKGKFVAYSHARDRLNRSFFKRAQILVNSMDDTIRQLMDVYNKVGEKIERNAKYRHKKIEVMNDK